MSNSISLLKTKSLEKLSAVIITLNEERNIGRCLDSLKGVVDEIIVLDSHSTDSTKNISLEKQATFIEVEWKGYSQTKNYGNSIAKYDWILSIDADEELSSELIGEIKQLKETGFEERAYIFNRLTNYCGKWINHCGWFPDKKPRIWNRKWASWEGEIHEKVKYSKPIKEKEFIGLLHHYSYYSIEQHIGQVNKYSSIFAEEAFRKGKKSSLFRIIFSPAFKFFRMYFLKLGFMDGYYGLIICCISAFATFSRYTKLRQLNSSN